MTKEKTRRIIIWGIVVILGVVFINTCMMTKIPDTVTRINDIEPITTYKFYQKNDGSYYSIEYDVIPEQPLIISFERSIFWPTDNDDKLFIYGNLFLENKHDTLYIKEISYTYNGENNILVKNKRIDIPIYDNYGDNYDILLDKNREPAMIDGKYLYGVRLSHGYFFGWREELGFDFTPKRYGEEKEFELIQIFSFDNETWYEEKYRYKVICGGKKFDKNRLHLNIGRMYL